MAAFGKNVTAPLLFLNLVLYLLVLIFACWSLDHFINGTTHQYPGITGNGATWYFLVFAILAAVLGLTSNLAGSHHLRVWRNDSLSAAASSAVVAWAVTALAFGLACKEIAIGGYRGWRLRVLEAFVIILFFSQLVYVLMLHAGMFSGNYGPETEYGATAAEHIPKGTGRV